MNGVAWSGDLDRAERLWREALGRHGDDPELLIGLAQTLSWKGQPALAEDAVFQFSREIKTPALAQEELVAVVLDSDVFASTQDQLADVRLWDAEGKSIPFLLRKVQTTRPRSMRSVWPARQLTARPLDDGRAGPPHTSRLSPIVPRWLGA